MRDIDPLCMNPTCELPLSACAPRMSDCCSRCSHTAVARDLAQNGYRLGWRNEADVQRLNGSGPT